MKVQLIISGEIELGDEFASQSDFDDMTDQQILECWGEDPLDYLLHGLRVKVQRDESEGPEYLFDGSWDRPRIIEWKRSPR